MEISEEQKRKILRGVKHVLSQGDSLSDDFIQEKLEKISLVLLEDAETDGGIWQEIEAEYTRFLPDFDDGLGDLSDSVPDQQL